MIETAIHQLRFVLSIAFGLRFSPRSLERFVASMQETIAEFGSLGSESTELVNGVTLDADTQREVITRRFRTQAKRAAQETPYYADLFAQLQLNPNELQYEDIVRIPFTTKNAVRSHPDAFVSSRRHPYIRATTTGTTGNPTSIYFSQHEMRVYFALTAMALLANRTLASDDIIQISVSGRGMLGNVCLAGAAAHIGATVYQTGVIEPEYALRMLLDKNSFKGKKSQTSILYTYPSYLGYLVEHGLAEGYKPADFGLEKISVGGEIVTEGLKERAECLFGDIQWLEGYGITELWPLGGNRTKEGLLEFELPQGLIEIINPLTGTPAQPGEIGTIVGTPFPPFRETTLLLRYDTEDLVRLPLQQSSHRLSTSDILGKKSLSIFHSDGWTTPRDVLEALERLEAVPLPAQFGISVCGNGVGVEIVTRTQNKHLQQQIGASLEANGIPLRALTLCQSPEDLTNPYPLRGNLREVMFTPAAKMEVMG
jgi:phenylacetate-CoA ligase